MQIDLREWHKHPERAAVEARIDAALKAAGFSTPAAKAETPFALVAGQIRVWDDGLGEVPGLWHAHCRLPKVGTRSHKDPEGACRELAKNLRERQDTINAWVNSALRNTRWERVVRTKGVHARDHVLHIPNGAKTYCGRAISSVNCCGETEWWDDDEDTFYEWCCRLCGPRALRSRLEGNRP